MEPCKYGKHIKLHRYYKLSTSKINIFNNIALKGCKNIVFTRFPFYNTKKNSEELALENNEGNCVSFAYYVQHLLKKKGIKSYLVGAKPPDIFFQKGYNEISHCAVIVPFNKGYVLFDTSFYFKKAVIVYQNNNHNRIYKFKNVYSEQIDKFYFKYDDDKIRIYMNGLDSGGYYKLYEIYNPHECITLPTNSSDKRIFRCEINKKTFTASFYYNINLYNKTLSLKLHNNLISKVNLPQLYLNNKFSEPLFKYWLLSNKHLLTTKQYKQLYKDISTFFNLN